MSGKGSSSRPRPDSFGPFAVRTDLGASRFGPVYLGRDSSNTRVVIRTFELSRELRGFVEQSDLLDSFRKLCETTFDHPGLARPLAFGAEGDIPYLVYSELAGTAMDVVIGQHGPRPVAEVLQRTTQLAGAIDCAASAGVHHGLMAPCDVILGDERAGVTGFGLAQALIKAGIPAEAVAPYGSPQRLAGAPPTRADDIYSLAAITLELLIGTPKDPDQDTRALREAQGLPERRRIPRPAPHETRVFTTIAGVDAGKLRASFAAAFSEEPSDRPSTAAEFVASFEDAFSSRGGTDEAAPSAVAPSAVVIPFVSEDAPPRSEEPVPAATPETSRPEHVVPSGRAARRRRARERRREKLAASAPPAQEPREHEPRAPAPESHPARPVPSEVERPEPIVDVEVFEDVTPPPRARSIDEASHAVPVRSGSRSLLVAVAVAFSFGAGFGGGFIAGQQSSPASESIDVTRNEPVADPQLTRTVVDDPQPVVSPTETVAPISKEKASSSEPIAETVAPRAVPAVESGRLLVRSTPSGASVLVDGQSRGVTPLTLQDLTFGGHTIEVSHPGHLPLQRRVTLSERRPTRSIDVELRSTSAPADMPAATKSGSLQVLSRPSGAQVFVDDHLIGTTPFLLSNITAGSKRLRIELSGYSIWTSSVQIEPGARSRVSASLEP